MEKTGFSVSNTPYKSEFSEQYHRPIRIYPNDKNRKKLCVFCQFHKVRTKSGYHPYTIFKCELCDIPLCIGERNCFRCYHSEGLKKKV